LASRDDGQDNATDYDGNRSGVGGTGRLYVEILTVSDRRRGVTFREHASLAWRLEHFDRSRRGQLPLS